MHSQKIRADLRTSPSAFLLACFLGWSPFLVLADCQPLLFSFVLSYFSYAPLASPRAGSHKERARVCARAMCVHIEHACCEKRKCDDDTGDPR